MRWRAVFLYASGEANFGAAGPGRADGRRALEAELRARRQLGPAARTQDSQRGGTLQAELRLGRVFLLAPGTVHPLLLLSGWAGSADDSAEDGRGQSDLGHRLHAMWAWFLAFRLTTQPRTTR